MKFRHFFRKSIMDKKTKKRISILQVLKEEAKPVSSSRITEILLNAGLDYSERTVRLYLKEMDHTGLTESHGRRGRMITQKGIEELHASQVLNRVGYFSAKIDQMTYRMNFDLPTCAGSLAVNTSIVSPSLMLECIDDICRVFSEGFAMGTRVALLKPGETFGNIAIPENCVGFCTVCSITINGVLLKHGIPMSSRFSGLLQIENKKPSRFVELIHYDATSIDPLEILIRAGMTDYTNSIRTGNGRIGAGFREMPADSREVISLIAERMEKIGLGAFMEIGMPSQSVIDIPVSEGRIGAIVIGGLNPIAILEEAGYRVYSRALTGLMEYHRLFHYSELPDRLKEIARKIPKNDPHPQK